MLVFVFGTIIVSKIVVLFETNLSQFITTGLYLLFTLVYPRLAKAPRDSGSMIHFSQLELRRNNRWN